MITARLTKACSGRQSAPSAESDRLASDPDERYIETAYHAENRVTGEQLTVAIDFRVIV